MKNKKGFTLVELLAVIAILAILVIISLPNVLDLFNNAKQNSFQTEVQTIFTTAQQEFLLGMGRDVSFYRNNVEGKELDSCTNKDSMKELSLKGTAAINYYIHIDSNGNIDEYYVADEAYAFSYPKSSEGLKIEEIGEGDKKVIIKVDKEDEYQGVVEAIAGKCGTLTEED